jgi:thiamine biosynthesis protein ThiI
LEKRPDLTVDVHDPELTISVEIRDQAYVYTRPIMAVGGMPVGTNGRATLLLSGGIDSPVAGWMIAKRGVSMSAVHFNSPPYTSERAKEKVAALAEIMSEYAGKIRFRVISLTAIQEALRDNCEEEYFTLLLRRSMMRLADRVAERFGCGALITGESLGQVASQTLAAIGVTDSAANRPIFRPCIGMDKEEIVSVARKIGTFETSILPFEDCCTVFTPKHPRTRPELAKVIEQEKKLDFDALVQEAIDGLTVEYIQPEF